jgi:hypothetical protein
MSPRLNSGYRSSELCRDIEGQDVGKHEVSQQLVLLWRPFFVAVAVGHFPFARYFNLVALVSTDACVRSSFLAMMASGVPAAFNSRRC